MLLPFPPDCEGLHLSLSVTSLSLPLSVSSTLSVLRALSLHSFTQRSLFHSSIPNVSSLCHRGSGRISIALYRWLVIWPGVIMNSSQGPGRQLFSPSVSSFTQTWPKMRHSSEFPDIWLFCLENPNPYALFKQTKMHMNLSCG